MKHAPDVEHPLTDQFAHDLYHRTPRAVLEAAVERPNGGWQAWEATLPAARDFYRDRARRFMAGDLSVLPWARAIGCDPIDGFGWSR